MARVIQPNTLTFPNKSSTPSSPASGSQIIYPQSDILRVKNNGGTVTQLDRKYPRMASLWHLNATLIKGNPITFIVMTTQPYRHIAYQNIGEVGATFEHNFLLDEGDYTFYVIGYTDPSEGAVNWYLDGKHFATRDQYTATGISNVRYSFQVSVHYAGRHTLRGVQVTGKSTAATQYLAFTKYWFVRNNL